MMIMAGDEAPPWSVVPVSILATVTQGTPEVSLDRMVADAIERRGARALDGSRHFLRWSDERTVELSGESLGAHTVVYLTPIPGTEEAQGPAADRDAGASGGCRSDDGSADGRVARAARRLHRDLRLDRRMTDVGFDYDRATTVVVPGSRAHRRCGRMGRRGRRRARRPPRLQRRRSPHPRACTRPRAAGRRRGSQHQRAAVRTGIRHVGALAVHPAGAGAHARGAAGVPVARRLSCRRRCGCCRRKVWGSAARRRWSPTRTGAASAGCSCPPE